MVTRLSYKEKKFKQSLEYKLWRDSVFRRDKWTCKVCGLKGKRIEAHHIYPFRDFEELRLELRNGIVLCFWCHRQIFGKELLIAKELLGLIENGVNSVELLNEDNTEPSLGGNTKKGVSTRDRDLLIKRFFKKKVHCNNCKKILYRHYYRVLRTKRFFCNQICYNNWQVKGLRGRNNPFYKPRPKNKCLFCGKYTVCKTEPSRKKKYCNNTCQLKYEYKNSLRKKLQKLGRWSRKYNFCIQCNGTKKHYGKGLCMNCYNKKYNLNKKSVIVSKKSPLEREDIVRTV